MPASIASVHAAQRLDSRGKPTVQVEVTTSDGKFVAIVPSGASKGDYEAIELRDGDKSAFGGSGVLKAVHNVEEIIGPAVIKKELDLTKGLKPIDDFVIGLDSSTDKSVLEANAILGGIPLYQFIAEGVGAAGPGYTMPVPFFNVLNGGVHSGNTMALQEFMVAPTGADSTTQAIQWAAEVYQELKELIIEKFDLLVEAFKRSGHEGDVQIGIDPASSEFFKNDKYDLGFKAESSDAKTKPEMAKLYNELIQKYPIVLLEDPFAQDDWEAWTAFNKECKIELVGDDLLATNVIRINEALEKKACNSLLLKINQIGTVSEALQAARRAYELGWAIFVSHRSGESTDPFIADLTVGIGCGHLKSGAPCRGERVVKYNRLMDIEDEIKTQKKKCQFAGQDFRTAAKSHGF